MAKVDLKAAKSEFDGWLSFKRIKESKRKQNDSFEEIIVDAIVNGDLSIDSNKVMTLKIVDHESLKELKFKPRIKVRELNIKLKPFKSDDADGRILAYIAAITDQNTGIISGLYTEDYTVCQAIAMYFL